MEEDHLKSGLSGKTNFLLKTLDGQSISTGPQRYTFTERLLTGDAKATFNQAALETGIRTIDNFNKVLMEMTKHAFPAYAFREQKRYLRRHLVKPRSLKLHSFISRLQELNAYLADCPPDTVGQATISLSANKIMNIIHHSMLTTWENKMIEQVFNYADFTVKELTDFAETRVGNMETNEDKKNNLLWSPRKAKRRKTSRHKIEGKLSQV